MRIAARLAAAEKELGVGDTTLWDGLGAGVAPGKSGNLMSVFCSQTWGLVDESDPDSDCLCQHWDEHPPHPGVPKIGAYIVLSAASSMLAHSDKDRESVCKMLGITSEQAEDHDLVDRRCVEVAEQEFKFTRAELRKLRATMVGRWARQERNHQWDRSAPAAAQPETPGLAPAIEPLPDPEPMPEPVAPGEFFDLGAGEFTIMIDRPKR